MTDGNGKVATERGLVWHTLVDSDLDEVEWRNLLLSLNDPYPFTTYPAPVYYFLLGSNSLRSAASLSIAQEADHGGNYDSSEIQALYEREPAHAAAESPPEPKYWLSNEICGLFSRASTESAAIIVPASSESDLSLLEFAVAHSSFRSRLLAIYSADKEAWDQLENQSWFHIISRHILLPSSSAKACSQFTAHLANLISGRAECGVDKLASKPKQAVAILGNAGIAEVQAASEAVKSMIPLVILAGSGGLCDWLPSLIRTKDGKEFDKILKQHLGDCVKWNDTNEKAGSGPCSLNRAFSEQDNLAMYLQKIKDGFSRGLVIVHDMKSQLAGSLNRILDEMSFRGKPCVVMRKRIQALNNAEAISQVKVHKDEKIVYVHGIPPSCDLGQLQNIMNEVMQKEAELCAGTKTFPALHNRSRLARAVYFLTVGASAVWKIRPKGESPDEATLAFLEPKKFVDSKTAHAYVKKKFDDPDMTKFEVYCLPNDPRIQFEITQTLITLIKEAKKQKAALIIPDYNSGSPGSLLIEQAIEHVGFRGPVINCGNDNWTAYDEEGLRQQYSFKGHPRPKPHLLSRATHSFLVENDEMSYSRLAALLAMLISGNSKQESEGGDDFDSALDNATCSNTCTGHRTSDVHDQMQSFDTCVAEQPTLSSNSYHKVEIYATNNENISLSSVYPLADESSTQQNRQFWVAVIACGGQSIMQHVSETVRLGMPLIILHGSGRVCDYLPGVFYNRFKSEFNHYEESVKVCKLCGFESIEDKHAVDQLFARCIQTILEDHAGVRIYVLGSGDKAMKRILENLNQKDKILDDATARFQEYIRAAAKLQWPNNTIRSLKIGIGLIITVLSTLQSQIVLESLADTVIHFILVVLPVLFSVVMSMEQDFNYNKQQTMLEYCACRLESEIYRYKMHSGCYSDMALGKKAGHTSSSQSSIESEVGFPSICTISERAQALTEAMIEIGSFIKAYDRSSSKSFSSDGSEAQKVKTSQILPEPRTNETKMCSSEEEPLQVPTHMSEIRITGDFYVAGRMNSLMTR